MKEKLCEFKNLAVSLTGCEKNQYLYSGPPDSKALDISIMSHWLDLYTEKQNFK